MPGMNRREFSYSILPVGAAVLAECRAAAGDQSISLLDPGRAAQVISGPQDLPAAEYFASAFEQLTGQRLNVATELPSDYRPVVLIGDAEASLEVRRLAGTRLSRLQRDGILILSANDDKRPVLVVAGGSRAATPGAVGELLNFHLDAGPGRAHAPTLDLVENPALPYRILWTWDFKMIWARGVRGEQHHGANNPYMKRPEDFLNDYRRAADFIGEHKLNGLIVWGLLRERHGGISSARSVVDYAAQRGVRLLAGIGTSHYGGFYYEGRHRFNVDTWLEQGRAELRYLDANNNRLKNTLCPSQPENQEWLRDGTRWLFQEFPELGGLNLENGDFMACQCGDCRRNRQKPENDPNYYYDMMVTQVPIIEEARKATPDAWMTYATYTGFDPNGLWAHTDRSLAKDTTPRFVALYPESAICQWTLTGMVGGWGRLPEAELRARWPHGLRSPIKHAIGLLHQGSSDVGSEMWWTRSARNNNTGERFVEISELIRYTCQRCSEEGLEGVEITGEVGDGSPANELNYLALEEFTWHPHRSMRQFVRSRLAKLYGGPDEAERYVNFVRTSEPSVAGLLKQAGLASEISRNRQFNARQRCRWENLASESARRASLV
jgi:hypothetical protein